MPFAAGKDAAGEGKHQIKATAISVHVQYFSRGIQPRHQAGRQGFRGELLPGDAPAVTWALSKPFTPRTGRAKSATKAVSACISPSFRDSMGRDRGPMPAPRSSAAPSRVTHRPVKSCSRGASPQHARRRDNSAAQSPAVSRPQGGQQVQVQASVATLRVAGQLHHAHAAETIVSKQSLALGAVQLAAVLRNPGFHLYTDGPTTRAKARFRFQFVSGRGRGAAGCAPIRQGAHSRSRRCPASAVPFRLLPQ